MVRMFKISQALSPRIALGLPWFDLAARLPWTVASGALLWALIPVAGPLGRAIVALLPAATILAGVAVAAAAAMTFARRLHALIGVCVEALFTRHNQATRAVGRCSKS